MDADAEVTAETIEEDLAMQNDDEEETPFLDTFGSAIKDVIEQK